MPSCLAPARRTQVLNLIAKLPTKREKLLPLCVDFKAMHPLELEALHHLSSSLTLAPEEAAAEQQGFWKEVLLQVAHVQALPEGSLEPKPGAHFIQVDVQKMKEGER